MATNEDCQSRLGVSQAAVKNSTDNCMNRLDKANCSGSAESELRSCVTSQCRKVEVAVLGSRP